MNINVNQRNTIRYTYTYLFVLVYYLLHKRMAYVGYNARHFFLSRPSAANAEKILRNVGFKLLPRFIFPFAKNV